MAKYILTFTATIEDGHLKGLGSEALTRHYRAFDPVSLLDMVRRQGGPIEWSAKRAPTPVVKVGLTGLDVTFPYRSVNYAQPGETVVEVEQEAWNAYVKAYDALRQAMVPIAEKFERS